MAKFYAVKNGVRPGIYKTWKECSEQVHCYPKAEYKKFNNLAAARNFMGLDALGLEDDVESNKSRNSNDCKTKKNMKKSKCLIAYVDGSYSNNIGIPTYGVVLIDGDNEKHISGRVEDKSTYTMRNVAGEISGAVKAIEFALLNGYKEIVIHHDYTGISNWCIGQDGNKRWKAKAEGTKKYQRLFDECKGKILIKFVKVKAHSGDKYNELADELAKNALCF